MESQYQKWVNLSYLACAALVAYVLFELSSRISGAYDIEAKVRNLDLILRGASIALGALTFWLLYRHDEWNQFMNEVMVELARVTWPTPVETKNATFIVIIMVVITGLVLGFLDYFWTLLLKAVL
jgi:preprotein translocase SecE subunit